MRTHILLAGSMLALSAFGQHTHQPTVISPGNALAPAVHEHADAKQAPPPQIDPKDGAFISFDKLSAFQVKVDWLVNPTNSHYDSLRMEGQIPDEIKSWEGKDVVLQGYIKPLQQDSELVSQFLLMRDQSSCCFGKPLTINEWVHVRMVNGGVKAAMHQLVTVYGTFHVGQKLENGNLVSIYRLDGKKLEGPRP